MDSGEKKSDQEKSNSSDHSGLGDKKIPFESIQEEAERGKGKAGAFDPKKIVNEGWDFFRENTEDALTYLLLGIGIIVLFLDYRMLGSLIVGLVAGYHFTNEVTFYLKNLTHVFDGHDQMRYVVITAALIALFIAVPGIFIGAIVAAAFKQVFDQTVKKGDK